MSPCDWAHDRFEGPAPLFDIPKLLKHLLAVCFHEVEEHADELPTSMLGLLRQMRDPEVRRGLAVTMAMLKRVSQQQEPGAG